MVLFMPTDQGGDAERKAKLDAIHQLIYTSFPGVLTDKKFVCVGNCSGNREVLDSQRYGQLYATISALVENAWKVDDDWRAFARQKRIEFLAEEHRREVESDLAERVRFEKEIANSREAMHRGLGFHVRASVGEDATNNPEDVRRVGKRLHELGFADQESDDVEAIGDAIYTYQSLVLRLRKPDGRIDPRGRTEAALRAGRKISMALP